ncbi:hypothetical protein ACELLULO517_15960 [Acidisoma cellulosilytica]|uniref:Uncharacterized protein n=1 Tax=Acidisoma cellulosilyticum TaxID=2802395 RepID=A0A964E4R9_9PROT|nr:hypothetical protein [Acidisoma cellulosilyticum]MCB8881744.1 hypothetical protein [Acidisoma cellulosilyticum]
MPRVTHNTSALPRISLICVLALPMSALAGVQGDTSGLDNGPVKPIRAQSADRFLSSLGVNTHVDQGYDPKTYIEPLRYLGVRAVRDGIRHIDSDVMIAKATGLRFDITGYGDLDGELDAGRTLAKAGALLALEGPNEPNNFPIHFHGEQGGGQGHSWKAVAAFQSALYQAVQTDPLLKTHPVFGPSETGAETDNVGLQFRTTPKDFAGAAPPDTRYSDDLNVHNYVSGTQGGYSNNQAWSAADPVLNGRWDGLYGNSGRTWLRQYQGYSNAALLLQPRVTTETGWDSISDPGGEAAQAAVLSNTYLAQFKRGWRFTFIYELKDEEGGTGHQGLFAGDRAKPAAVYIHNLTTILADRHPLPQPGELAFSIKTGATTVHDLLLQKSSGEFDLVIWDERKTGQDSISVTFGKPQALMEVFDIAKGVAPQQSLHNVSLANLTLSDHAVIIRIPPPARQ